MNAETSDLRSKGAQVFFDAKLILASLSLGGILLVSEAERIPTLSFAANQSDPSLLRTIFLVVFFGALLIGKYFKPSMKQTPQWLVLVLSLALSGSAAGILSPAGFLPPWAYELCNISHSILWPILLYIWVREMLPLGYSYTMQSFAFGLVTLGILNFLSMAMNAWVSVVFITLLPVASAVLLLAIKTPERSYAPETSFGHDDKAAKSHYFQFVIFNIVPLTCFAIVFGNVHLSWSALQDGTVMSLIVQLGVAAGTLLAGLGVLGLYKIGTLRKYSSIVMLILIAFTLFSIWLSTYTNGNLVFLYTAFLNVAPKGVFLLIFLAPFRGPWRDPLFGWCASMCAFLYGTYISSSLMSFNAEMILVTFAVIALCLLMVCSVAMLVNDIEGAKLYQRGNEATLKPLGKNAPGQGNIEGGGNLEGALSSAGASNSANTLSGAAISMGALGLRGTANSANNPSASPDVTGEVASPPAANQPPLAAPPQENNTTQFTKDEEYVACMRLTHEFALTRREADVLTLLVHGRTAEPIAKTLGISHATAKTHLRNIYNKLGVHTQQEVIDLMEDYLRKE